MIFSFKFLVNVKWPDDAGAGSVIDSILGNALKVKMKLVEITAFCMDLPDLYVMKQIYAVKVPLFNIFNMVSKTIVMDSENIFQVEVNSSPRRICFFCCPL